MSDRVELRAQAAIFDEGRLLCDRHVKAGGTYWVLPGGHVEAGETLWAAAVREIEEETALVLEAGRLWALSEFQGGGRHVVECTFLATAWHGTVTVGHDPEGASHEASLAGIDWLDRERFERENFLPPTIAGRLRELWNDSAAPAAYLGAAP
jgi:ADP-ribose pyrophosphatase YjhB (NUDIX family)